MKYVVTTDTHFGHRRIIEYGRPADFEDIVYLGLREYAAPCKVLIHIGDICIGDDRYWNRKITELPYAKKWLIKGNHDKQTNSWYLKHGWDMVCDRLQLNYMGEEITFTHKPVRAKFNIHGHFHDIPEERIRQHENELFEISLEPTHILLALEKNDYYPYLLEKIVNEYKKNNYAITGK